MRRAPALGRRARLVPERERKEVLGDASKWKNGHTWYDALS